MGISVILLAYKEENKEKVEALAWERCAVWLRMFSVIRYILYAIVSYVK